MLTKVFRKMLLQILISTFIYINYWSLIYIAILKTKESSGASQDTCMHQFNETCSLARYFWAELIFYQKPDISGQNEYLIRSMIFLGQNEYL